MTRRSGSSFPAKKRGVEIRLDAFRSTSLFCSALIAFSAGAALAKSRPKSSPAPAASVVPTVQATPAAPVTVNQEVRDIFDRYRRCVVKVHAQDEHSDIYGTGFFIDPTGTLYTAFSVAGDAVNFSVEYKGKTYPARLIMADLRSGIAMLKVDLVSPAIPVGKAADLEVATPVLAIGFPLDLPETPSFGMIAGFDHKYLGRYFFTRHLRVNLPTQRGEAGAPLLNLKGEVVGIVVGSLENESACYALPIEAAEKVRGDVARFGEVRHGWVGAQVSEAKDAIEGSRTVVTDISGTVTVADGGLRPGDVLLKVGKIDIHEPEDVIDGSFFLTAGDTVPVVIIRDGKKVTLNIETDFHPMSSRTPPLLSTMPSNTPNRSIPLGLQPQSIPQ
jgi:serine protease Do